MYYDDHHDYHDQIRQYGSELRKKNSVNTSVSTDRYPKAPPNKGPVIKFSLLPGLFNKNIIFKKSVFAIIAYLPVFSGFVLYYLRNLVILLAY